jgi:ubiquinone/menaquinone biosynthesis C-methylase UbiE
VTPVTDPASERVHHPIFARVYARIGAAADRAGAAEHRARLLAGLQGRVVEVGAGTGLNFKYYPQAVREVVAVEPEASLRTIAEAAAAAAPVAVTVLPGTAGALPLGDASVDAAVSSLVLCSVADQAAALAEIRRVLRPAGELRFYEHVRAPDGTRLARVQGAIDPLWTRLAGGCHLTRATADSIARAGFVIEECDRFLFQPCWLARITGPHVLGRARRP